MDITAYVVSGRDKAKLYGDHASYRTSLSNRIHNLRKKLGISTKPRAKYAGKEITAEDVGRNKEFAYLMLLTSERAWANAMSMREIHATEKKGITGSTRTHIISRLHKASSYATSLFTLLSSPSSGAPDTDILEARAYAASLSGARDFERQNWEQCVKSYAEARIIYAALATSTKSGMFGDLLTDPVDPSIRYAAYQMRLPRTVAIPSIARKYFPSEDSELVEQIEKLDLEALREGSAKATTTSQEEGGAVPKTIAWRSRTVDLEDAAIATALGAVSRAAETLGETLAGVSAGQAKEKAAAYDDILIFSQDAVDATKHAIDELVSEGVGQGDRRMQSLQITRTAVSYEMVSWRIGRNRVLVGEQDGAVETPVVYANKKKNAKPQKEEGTGRKLAHLREKAVLYDSILQSLDSIKELPGVAADEEFGEELDAKYGYFSALKCLTLFRSHALLSSQVNALALLARASQKASMADTFLSSQMETDTPSAPNITITPTQSASLSTLLSGHLQAQRALVELSNLSASSAKAQDAGLKPLIETLHMYPSSGKVDLGNIVTYPPKLEPIPVKPLFFDAAWNYIEYPGREREVAEVVKKVTGASEEKVDAGSGKPAEGKKGWFGFGR